MSHFPTTLAPLALGNVQIGFPVVQAALSGYSDWAMRVVARRMGAPYTLCEVVLDRIVLAAGRKLRRRWMRIAAEEHPVGCQLMGSQPEEFAAAAREMSDAGFDVIDINFGCPVKKVLGQCRGGYLLSQPDKALEIVDRVRHAVPPEKPVTVKMRRGMDDTTESRDNFFTIFDGALARGVSAFTVHGRTVRQRYDGPSRWEFLRDLRRHAPQATLLGSGDLFTPAACLEMIAQTGMNGVTVARGAIGNPWVFGQARALAEGRPLPAPPGLHEQKAVLLEHFGLALELYGEEAGSRHMRKTAIRYAQSHPQPLAVRDAFVRIKSQAEFRAVLDVWYAEDLPGRYPWESASELTTC